MNYISIFIIVLARVLNVAIFIRIILSWMPISRSNPIVTFIYDITEPILGPIRRVMPSLGGFDLSPMIALILIQVAERVLLTLLPR
mgnify:CR=1 FL=1